MRTNSLEEALQAIRQLRLDIRAEAIVADLVENDIDHEDIQVNQQGAFLRPVRRDVLSAEIKNNNDAREILELFLSRNSIYDALPEGLFHQPGEELPHKKSVTTLAAEYKKRKQQEKEARLFFQPLENEFFRQRVDLELKERQLLRKFRHLFNDFLLSFWKIDDTLPREFTIRLIRILPLANELTGNMANVAQALAYTLNEQVTIEIEYKRAERPGGGNRLGQTGLGHDFIAGNMTEPQPVAVVTVGPITNGNVQDFLPGGEALRFAKVFYSYFMPFHIDVETEILTDTAYRPDPKSLGVLHYALQL